MGSILIDKIRIKGFRGLNNIELSLQDTTILTGANNAGKTSVLKALQLALGNRAFLTIDDFNISNNIRTDSIIVDIRIIPVDVNNNRAENFDENWEACFTEKSILMDASGFAYVPIRTIYTNNLARGDFDKTQRILKLWESDISEWYDIECSKNKPNLDSIPFFYIEAQRDVVEDLKVKNSFLGRMLSQITESYSDQDVKTIEGLIEDLNQKAIDSSNVLSIIQSVLSGVDSTIDNDESSVKLTPFAKKIRDLNKSISIQYGKKDHSFSMEYHGMGTRSWSSLLAFKAFIKNIVALSSEDSDSPLYPIIAIEEPEAHLHPNAQKKLYAQIHDMPGQKIVSTHSPYIAASAELGQLRNLYKSEQPTIGELSISSLNKEELRKIKQKVVNTKGEIIFSKVLVLFEGETEEQALPIFATHYWDRHPSQLGIDFVSVGGAGQYYPFLKFAHDFKIPVFIFSDGEDKPIKEITKAIFKVYGSEQPLSNYENVIIIPNGCDFEAMLLEEGYQDQIIEALKSIKGDYVLEDYIRKNEGKKKSPHKTDRICKTCNQPIYEADIRHYVNPTDALDDIMETCKTDFGPAIAYIIIDSNKEMPKSIKKLFDRINHILKNV